MAGGRSERFERNPETGPGNLACRDGIAHRDGVIAAADVAGAGETLLQHGPHEDGAIEGPVESGMGEPIFGGVHAAGQVARDVDMAIDESRHHSLAGEIDDFGAGRSNETGLNRGNAVVADDNRNFAPGRVRHAVEQRAGVNDHVAGEGGWGEQRDDDGAAK